jgi:hypothetical protein
VSNQYDKNQPILKQSEVLVPMDGSAFAEAILPHALLFAPGCEAFIERISGSGQGNVLVVVTRAQALEGGETFLRHRDVPVLLLAN